MKKMLYSLMRNRKITLFFVLLIIAAGIFGFIENPKQESPDFSIPYAMITTVFPGASQSDVDAFITEPIEQEIRRITGYESSFSYSSNSLSLVIVEFKFSADKEQSFRDLNEAMRSLQSELPAECSDIDVNTKIVNTAGVLISVSSDEISNKEAAGFAGVIADELMEIDGIERYEIIGDLKDIITVTVNREKMKAAGLTLAEISEVISAGNTDIPIGKIEEEDTKTIINYEGTLNDIEDIKNLELAFIPEANRIIRISDVADVTEEVASLNTYYKNNGRQAVIIAGYFEDGINILPLEKQIEEKLDDLEKILPDNVDTSLIISQPAEVEGSLNNFSINLLAAVLLVILVILIGMGFRNALVVSVSLPLSILISFGVMYIIGIKIQQVSIAALIVSLGMLVDNSIVVSDSIQGYLDEGMKKKKACVAGVRDVAGPVFTSTITTIAAFMPFLFLNSLAGDYIKSLPQIVSISLAASYFTAILIIPVLAYILFKPKKHRNTKKRVKLFKKMLKGGLKRKWIVVVIVVILITGSVFLALELNTVFFPASDKNVIYVDIRNNSSDNLKGTIALVENIESLLENEEVILEYTSSSGGGLPRFNQIMFIYTQTPDTGQIMLRIDLKDSDYRTNEEYKIYLQDKIDGMGLNAKITVKELMYAFPMDEDLKIRIAGDDLDILKSHEGRILDLLSSTKGLINVNKGNTDYIDEFKLEILEEEAVKYGIFAARIQNELSLALLGREAAVILRDKEEIPVIVTGDYSSQSDIDSIPIRTAAGNYITASEITNLIKESTLSTIPRFNGDYAMTLTADYDSDFSKSEILEDIKSTIEDMNLDDVSVIYEGEDELIKENFGQVGVLGIFALAAVFIILLLQFKSFMMPLLIFITIPLSAIGSIAGLYISGQAISFTALLGIVSLLGIVVNNAIILIDYIRREKAKGIKTNKACINASQKRLRPILLSTITTVIGLIPLAIGTSQLFKPMAIALMSGLLVSTLLTLIVLPVFVSIVYKK